MIHWYWASWHDFLAMGGYGLYVWGSFVMTGVALAWELLLLTQRRRQALETLREEVCRDAAP